MDHAQKPSLPGTSPRVQIAFPVIIIPISLCLVMSVYIHPVQADVINPADFRLGMHGDRTEAIPITGASTDRPISVFFEETTGYYNLKRVASFDITREQRIQPIQGCYYTLNPLPDEQGPSKEMGVSVI